VKLVVESGGVRSHSLGNSIWKRLWTCRKTRLHDDDVDDNDDDSNNNNSHASMTAKIHPSLSQCGPSQFDLDCIHFPKFRSNFKIIGAEKVTRRKLYICSIQRPTRCTFYVYSLFNFFLLALYMFRVLYAVWCPNQYLLQWNNIHVPKLYTHL
jgi:hypothetical protein